MKTVPFVLICMLLMATVVMLAEPVVKALGGVRYTVHTFYAKT